MSVADLFDEIVSAARRKTASATTTYESQVAVLAQRVRVRAEEDRHRRGVTRESAQRSGAILMPADDIDLSPHSPIPSEVPIAGVVDDPIDETTTPAESDRIRPVDPGVQSSFEQGWLTDR